MITGNILLNGFENMVNISTLVSHRKITDLTSR